MYKVVTFHSFYRGTGKSTLIANLAVLQAKLGYRVGVIDQALSLPSLHTLFGLTDLAITQTLNDYLRGSCELRQAIYDVTPASVGDGRGRVLLLPASAKPGSIAQTLGEGFGVELLHQALDQMAMENNLDSVLLDTQAGIQEATLPAMAISRTVVVILRLDQEDYQGTSVSIEVVHRLAVPRLLLIVNQVDPRMDLAEVKRSVEEFYTCDVGAVLPTFEDFAKGSGDSLFVLREPEHYLTENLRQVAARALL